MSDPITTDPAKLERWVTQQKQFNVVVILALLALAIWEWTGRQQFGMVQQSAIAQQNLVESKFRVLRAQIGKARDLDELRRWMEDPDPTAGLRSEDSPR